MTSILRGEEIPTHQEPLLEVFRNGYEDRYVGDERFLEGYVLPAHVAIIDGSPASPSGAALMRNSRVTAIATQPESEFYGPRFSRFVGLLQVAHAVDDEAWIGIGTGAKAAVKRAASQAGMERSHDDTLLRTRLERSGKMDQYIIQPSSAGLVISLADSNHGTNYWQEVWDWNST